MRLLSSHSLTFVSFRALTVLTILAAAAVSPAHAQFFNNNTGIASPTSTITFSEVVLASGTAVTNQYAAKGATFSGLYYNPQPIGNTFPNMSEPAVGNFSGIGQAPLNLTDTFSIFFTAPKTSAGFALATNTGSTLFEALSGVTVVASATAATDSTSFTNYYGFSGIAFDQIRVTILNTITNKSSLIDNVQVGATALPTAAPEPGSLALLLPVLGVASRGIRKQKRR